MVAEKYVTRKINTQNNTYKWFEWRHSKGYDNTFISIGIDITQRKKQELTRKIIYNITKKPMK